MSDLPAGPRPQPDPSTDVSTDGPPVESDDGEALERAAGSIRDAKAAEGTVAANEDITSLDDQRAGEHSETPEGGGGLP